MLYEHDMVIVPELGAFLTHTVGSRYDEQQGIMLPPCKEVAFNSDVRHADHDNLLARYLQKTEDMTERDAAEAVLDFATDTRSKLEAGNAVLLPDLGSLTMSNGRIYFEPKQGLNVLIESYGLSGIRAEKIQQDIFEGVDLAGIRKAAISAAVLVAFLLISPRTSDPTFVGADFSQALSEFYAPAAQDTTPKLEASALVEEPLPAPETVAPTPVETKTDRYYLVVASFLSKQEAQDYIASMRAKGVTDLEVLDYGGRCRVVAASYDNQSAANSANGELRTVQGFEKSWVLHVAL